MSSGGLRHAGPRIDRARIAQAPRRRSGDFQVRFPCRYINLMLTMTIGGLWHGAGWAFVVWGALHGAYLAVNHAWSALRGRIPVARVDRAESLIGWVLTFGA